ncbi:LPS-assembly protein LptD [Rhizosphaericola mali]|uniref:LPS-assembly protein LptD n=2 Tax=Rhizosphaericola mali TaxID=2545455 RepID=A0A5P2G1W2_9BACT|nr:LPS-assembly protein LptD [Rhizosphaericola mali]
MNNRGKVRGKRFCIAVLCCITMIFISMDIKAKRHYPDFFGNNLTIFPDTPIQILPKIILPDTIPASYGKLLYSRSGKYLFSKHWGDTSDNVRMMSFYSSDTLPAPIAYSASDSAVIIVPTKQLWLYNKATVKYKPEDMTLEAPVITFDQATGNVKFYQNKDTVKHDITDTSYHPLDMPTITQGSSKTLADTGIVNIKTKKGLTKNTYYNEGELFVHADIVKKVSDDVAYAWKGRFTTCNLDTPHFDFRAKKLKLITNKIAVSGPAYPEFEGVPMPVFIPFGIYPLTQGRHSGMLPPQFANNGSYGLGLEGLGYYQVMNDNWDMTVRSNIYTYGGYMFSFNPRYFNRYHYSGNLLFTMQQTVILNSSTGTFTDDEFTKNKSFQLTWSHTMDSKAHPGITFSANVNAGSTSFNRYVSNNAVQNFQNQMSSSITWAKTWGDGKYNLSVAANHNQNNNTRIVNVNAPTVNFSMNTVYPFAKKEAVGTAKWYEKLGISYTGTAINQIAFYDSSISVKRLMDTAQWGVTHSIPITLSLPSLGPVMVSPSISYSQNWYGRKMDRQWNSITNKVDTLTSNLGFYRAQQMSFGVAFSSRIFGNYNFKNGNIQTLHHEIRPTISLNYQPDMNRSNYQWLRFNNRAKYNVALPNGLTRTVYGDSMRVSKFQGNVVGAFSEGSFGGMTFGFDNILEMKKRKKEGDTTENSDQNNKVKLIDGLSITSGYNFMADSLKWQPVNFSFRTTLFNKININGSAVLDQYARDSSGIKINKLLWSQGKVGNFTSGTLSFSSSFQSKKSDGKSDQQRLTEASDPNITYSEQQQQLDYIRSNPAEFVDFDIPWNVTTSFALNYYKTFTTNYRYVSTITSSLNLNGDFSITPKWKAGGNLMFDVKAQKVQMMTLFLTREMHCWQMAINITPIGLYKSFSIVLNPKSGILRDLKINRSRFFYNNGY